MSIMSLSLDQLEDFHRFAQQKLQSGDVESLEELCDLWRIEHPSAEEEADIQEAFRQGLADIEAGNYRPADEVMAEIRAKYGL